jgi:hypothetical protein
MDSPLASTDALSPFAKPTTATERERSVRGHQRPCFLAAARERERGRDMAGDDSVYVPPSFPDFVALNLTNPPPARSTAPAQTAK